MMPAAVPLVRSVFLFDLDGTLIDSRADIALSVNLALRRMGFARLPEGRILEFVGEGLATLMERSLRESTGAEPDPARIREAAGIMMEEYSHHLLDSTILYDGVREALGGLRWGRFGLVSNKPERFSRSILESFGLAGRFSVILGGDSMPERKPDPKPVLEAMRRCGGTPGETVMVGDSAVDILAGRAAGVLTCGLASGYRTRAELEDAGCDLILESIRDLLACFLPPPL